MTVAGVTYVTQLLTSGPGDLGSPSLSPEVIGEKVMGWVGAESGRTGGGEWRVISAAQLRSS